MRRFEGTDTHIATDDLMMSPGEMSATPPSTSEYVRFHALHRPGAIALIDEGRAIDYSTFHRDLGKFTRALRQFGLPARSYVAVAWEGLYLHWLLLLACENLGIATASFLRGERDELRPLLARVQLVLCGHELPAAGGTKCHLLTQDWLDGVFASPDQEGSEAAGDTPVGLADPQRIRRSSGTTGGLKMMVVTRRVEEQWVLNYLLAMGFTPCSKLVISTRFTVGSMHLRATACLRLGATCIYDTRTNMAHWIAQYRPSHVRLFPYDIKPLLDRLPNSFLKPADLTVMLGAGPISEALTQRILERLASRIVYTYNCNEAGSIAMVGADGVCTLRPGVQAEVIDERGAPVPVGQVGRVRVKTMSMVDGYLDNADATARMFRDGWFHTGDAGMMLASGQLKLVGRSDELLNIGGLKVSPAAIEEKVGQSVPLEDLGVTSIQNPDGIEELCIAVVLRDGSKLGECSVLIQKCMLREYGKSHIRAVDRIPRTAETGKIQRDRLKKIFDPK